MTLSCLQLLNPESGISAVVGNHSTESYSKKLQYIILYFIRDIILDLPWFTPKHPGYLYILSPYALPMTVLCLCRAWASSLLLAVLLGHLRLFLRALCFDWGVRDHSCLGHKVAEFRLQAIFGATAISHPAKFQLNISRVCNCSQLLLQLGVFLGILLLRARALLLQLIHSSDHLHDFFILAIRRTPSESVYMFQIDGCCQQPNRTSVKILSRSNIFQHQMLGLPFLNQNNTRPNGSDQKSTKSTEVLVLLSTAHPLFLHGGLERINLLATGNIFAFNFWGFRTVLHLCKA